MLTGWKTGKLPSPEGKRQTELTKTKICIGKWKKTIGNEKDSPLRHSSGNHKTNSIEAAFYVLLPQSADWKVSWSEKVNIIHPNQNWMIDLPLLSPTTFLQSSKEWKSSHNQIGFAFGQNCYFTKSILESERQASGADSMATIYMIDAFSSQIKTQTQKELPSRSSSAWNSSDLKYEYRTKFRKKNDQKPFGSHAV